VFISAQSKIFSPYGGVGCFDFDFNILTAFIRLGRAGPAGAGCPPYSQALGRVPSILLLILFDFIALHNIII